MKAAHAMETGIEDDFDVAPDLLINYTSRRKRSFFPYSTDEMSIRRLMSVILKYDYGGEGPDLFAGRDIALECSCCRYEIPPTSRNKTVKRETLLHTFHHGTVPIHIYDLRCDVCRQLNSYNGLDEGIFALDKNHDFMGELIDSWMWEICGTGGTFRDTFSSWASKRWFTSALYHHVGTEPMCNRQRPNDVYTAFLGNLYFPNESYLNDLFSSMKCERIASDRKKRFDGIVMDGTAMGILGKLPEFVRVKSRFSRVQNLSNKQYIIRTPRLREFVDSILTSAKQSFGVTDFKVVLKNSLWDRREELSNQFFNDVLEITSEVFVGARFLKAIFTSSGSIDPVQELGDGKDEEDATQPSGATKLRFIIDDTDICRTSIDFGRCFVAGSIAGGCLRNEHHLQSSQILSDVLVRFPFCFH